MRRFVLPPVVFIPILLGLFLPTVLVASWQKVFTCRVGGNGVARAAYCGYFFNELIGMVGAAGDAGIFLTNDGGKTWTKAAIPAAYNGNITQIFMTDRQRGWATVEEPSATKQGLWRTTDGGNTWTTVGPNEYLSSVYETPSALIATGRYYTTTGSPPVVVPKGGLISTDGGSTFQTGVLNITNGIDFVDNTYGVVTGFQNTPWKRTVDGGQTWMDISPLQSTESWSVYGRKGTSTFFASPEKDPRNRAIPGMSDILRSDDYGANWRKVSTLSFYSCGSVLGARGILYVQADSERRINPTASGIYRSTDDGVTWVSVGGPSTSQDSRFVVTGCSGGVVYAFDGKGNVWKTRDGGDGAIQEPSVELEISGTVISLAGNICETTFASLGLLNHYCEDDTIQLIEVIDPASELFTSGALSVISVPPLPRALTEGQEDSIVFKWEPGKLFHTDTIITTQLRLRYYSNIYQRTIDTIITVTLHAIGVEPAAIVAPTILDYGPVNFCAPFDTLITIKNLGCDTLIIWDGVFASMAGISMTDGGGNPFSYPIRLLPGDVANFRVTFFITVAGDYTNSLTFQLQHQGIRRDTIIPISASVDSKGSYMLADSLFAGIVSTCNPRDTALPVLNLGCTDLVITNASITGSNTFTLGTPPYTSPIKPGTSGSVVINFFPATAGIFDAILHLNFTTLGEGKTIDIPLHGIGTTDPAFLSTPANLDTLFDLHLTRCDSGRPFTISLFNPGCPDKVTINSVTMQPPSNPDISVSWGNTPIDLFAKTPPFDITVAVSTKIVGTFNGKITINFQIGNQPPRDTTVLYFLDVKYGSRILALDKDTINLGTINFCETSDATILIRNPGCDSLEVFTYSFSGSSDVTMTPSPQKLFATNEQTLLNLHLLPTTTGPVIGHLDITSNSDTAANRTIPIVGFVIPTDTIAFDILATRQNIRVGDTVTFVLMSRGSATDKNMTDLSFDINYNSDLLELLSDPDHLPQVLIPNVLYVPSPFGGTPKHTKQKIFLQGLPFIEIDSGKPVMILTFLARLTDTISTTMFLSDISINSGNPNFSKCVLGAISSELGYSLILDCGEPTLMKYMQLGSNFTLKALSVIPDPLTRENGYKAKLPVAINLAGEVTLQIFDPNGKQIISTEPMRITDKGIYNFMIDATLLPSGLYNYLLKHQVNAEEVSGSFRVLK